MMTTKNDSKMNAYLDALKMRADIELIDIDI